MNIAETIALLRKVKAHCPSQVIDEYTPEAWAEVLDDIRWVDANQALINICKMDLEPGRARYIEPGHIRGEVRKIRSRRLSAYGTITPPELPWMADIDWLGNDPLAVKQRLTEDRYVAEMRQKIGDGEIEPGETIPVPVITDAEVQARVQAIEDRINNRPARRWLPAEVPS